MSLSSTLPFTYTSLVSPRVITRVAPEPNTRMELTASPTSTSRESTIPSMGARAHARAPVAAEARQQPIAGGMAFAIVDLLEPVEIEHGQRQRVAGAIGQRSLARGGRHESAAVEQPRQIIGARLAAQILAEAAEQQADRPDRDGHHHPVDEDVGQAH